MKEKDIQVLLSEIFTHPVKCSLYLDCADIRVEWGKEYQSIRLKEQQTNTIEGCLDRHWETNRC